MKFKKVLVTGFSRENLDENAWERINKLTEVVVSESDTEVDCLLSRFNKVDKPLIDSLPRLKYIGVLATGVGTVDLNYAKEKGVVVCNIPGYCTESVAEYVFAVILEQLRDLERARQVARAGDFSGDGFSATEIKGKKFGIIGLGRIGSRVAEIALAFGAEVSYWSKNRKPEMEVKGIVYQDLDTLITTSDFLSLHTNKTDETVGILSAQRLTSIKAGAMIINISPMELVDMSGLEKRLVQGDTTFIFDHPDEMEKVDVERLAKYKNCIVYPPIGYISKEARIIKQDIFVSNLEKFLLGSPSNQVN